MTFETLEVRPEGAVWFANIAATPMNLLGTELIRDLVSLIQAAESARDPEAQRRMRLAMSRGFQTHDGELALPKMVADLADR
jgi:hypothetical protein